MSRPERTAVGSSRIARKNIGVPSTRTPTSTHDIYGRSKSRSPSRGGTGSRLDPFTLDNTPAPTVKRKRSSSLGTSIAPPVFDDTDRGQRIKPKSSSSMQNRSASSGSTFLRPKKERERPRATLLPTHEPLVEAQPRRGVDKGKAREVDAPVYTGALAAAEYERMRKELENMKDTVKKTVSESKKLSKKQNKMIEDLRTQLTAETQALEDKEKLLSTVSSKSRKNEDLLQTIETSLQCQICIELLSKPNILAPCGHIFCLECLQQWFRSAPGHESAEEMDPDDREDMILHRPKSCPCCRARVARRPVPVFVVKSVVTALRNATQPSAIQDEGDSDPWKGLFLPDYDSSEVDDDGYGSSEDDGVEFFDHYSDDLEDSDAEIAIALALGAYPQHIYASPSESDDLGSNSEDEEEEEEGEVVDDEDEEDDDEDEDEDEDEEDGSEDGATYAMPRWEPPLHTLGTANASPAFRKMQRRGCTLQLIAHFNVRYSHHEGIVAHISSLDATAENITMGRNRLFLGWNINVEPQVSGIPGAAEKAFIGRQLRDMRRHPERWAVHERPGYPGRGVMDAHRLALVEEDIELYDTSESDAYSIGEEDL
ncbi:ring finger domain protein [Favolaschia claudopus]|uniref:Ring finger domain protein n=1 Tax=Favolaschia claudopus TaxID=2862362 RepID=A0AAW0BXJ4_9AGAR